MSLVAVVLVLLIIGVCLWAVGLIPMDAAILRLIRVVVIIAVVVWLISLTGLLPGLDRVPFPHK